MRIELGSDGLTLAGHLAMPPGRARAPGVVLCHGFPTGKQRAETVAGSYPDLADRIAGDLGWACLTFSFRGAGESEGDFSLGGWLTDLRSAVDTLRAEPAVERVWIAGASTGGSLAVCVAADDPAVEGVATLAARADFDDWASQPRRFLEHCREVGLVRDPRFPAALDEWALQLRRIRPAHSAPHLAPRPLLVVHGDDDSVVPVADARILADAHGTAELRVLPQADHSLRDDPRAVAMLLGWLDRERHRVRA